MYILTYSPFAEEMNHDNDRFDLVHVAQVSGECHSLRSTGASALAPWPKEMGIYVMGQRCVYIYIEMFYVYLYVYVCVYIYIHEYVRVIGGTVHCHV